MNTDGNRLWSIQWSILCTVASHTPFTYTCLVWQKSIWQVGRVHDIWVFLSITSMSCLHWMLKTVYLHVNFYSEAGAFAFVHTETQQSEALNSFFLILVIAICFHCTHSECLVCSVITSPVTEMQKYRIQKDCWHVVYPNLLLFDWCEVNDHKIFPLYHKAFTTKLHWTNDMEMMSYIRTPEYIDHVIAMGKKNVVSVSITQFVIMSHFSVTKIYRKESTSTDTQAASQMLTLFGHSKC